MYNILYFLFQKKEKVYGNSFALEVTTPEFFWGFLPYKFGTLFKISRYHLKRRNGAIQLNVLRL